MRTLQLEKKIKDFDKKIPFDLTVNVRCEDCQKSDSKYSYQNISKSQKLTIYCKRKC